MWHARRRGPSLSYGSDGALRSPPAALTAALGSRAHVRQLTQAKNLVPGRRNKSDLDVSAGDVRAGDVRVRVGDAAGGVEERGIVLAELLRS